MQHLVDEMGSAGQAALQLRQRTVAFRAVAGAQGDLQLGLQRGERRAQFVRGVGGELTLGFEGGFDALEQAVQRLQHGADFFGGGRRSNWLQLLRRPAGDLPGDAVERGQPVPGRQPDPEADQRQAEEGG